MKTAHLLFTGLLTTAGLSVVIMAADSDQQPISIESSSAPVCVDSLRGHTPIDEEDNAPRLKKIPKESERYPLQYVGQPPLIPHAIRGYHITINSNKCLQCHSWENAVKMKAPRISITHFTDRQGKVLADVSPNRYFCTQCHVPQANAKPLVPNIFEPVDSLKTP